MTLQELYEASVEETGRPDKETLIERTVVAFVLKAHEIDFFPRDRVIDSDVDLSGQSGEVITLDLPERWRRFEFIEPLGSDGASLRRQFTKRSPDDLVDFDDNAIVDIYQVIGNSVILNAACSISKLRWVYFAYPDLTGDESSTQTWITERYPQAIIDGVAGNIIKKLGDTKRAALYLDNWREWQVQIRNENLLEDI